MTIRTVAQVADAYSAGRHWSGYLRRGNPYMTVSYWTDLSYAAGIPVANYYAATPLVAEALPANDGIMHGPPVNAGGHKKYLHKALILPPATSVGLVTMHVHDIVAFYPFIDGDGGYQEMVNELGQLRYNNGEGCRIMIVSQGAGVATGTDVSITYTNTTGEQKTLSNIYYVASNGAGLLCAPADGWGIAPLPFKLASPYLELANGDTGVSKIDSINIPTAVGGIAALVIVKPLATISWQELLVPIEVDYMRDRLRMTEIEDGACVHVIAKGTVGNSPATILGEFSFIWG